MTVSVREQEYIYIKNGIPLSITNEKDKEEQREKVG